MNVVEASEGLGHDDVSADNCNASSKNLHGGHGVFVSNSDEMNMAFFSNQSQTTIDILDIEHVHDRTSKYS